MTEIEDRIKNLYQHDTEPFDTSGADSLEFVDEDDPSTSFGLGDTAMANGLHALLLGNEEWPDWLAKSARYRLYGLRLYEQTHGETKPIEYDDALCAAVLSGNEEVIEEVVEEIRSMPDDLHDMAHEHDEVVRETVRCLAELVDGDVDATERALETAKGAFEDAKEEDGLQLIEGDRTDRFVGTFGFVQGVLDDDPQAIDDAIERLLNWHETEVFDGQTTDHVARWAAMLYVLARREGFDPDVDHDYVPDELSDR